MLEPQLRTEYGCLERRSVRRVAEQRVGKPVRKRIHWSGYGYTEVLISPSTGVLNSCDQTGTNRTMSPGASSAGDDLSGSNISSRVRPMICQPPGDSHG